MSNVSIIDFSGNIFAGLSLQLQLEENFFRIQPDFVKRLSDFTVERQD